MKEINAAICALVTLVLFVLSFLQFKGKGPVLNSSMLVSGKGERAEENLKRWYRRSARVFLALGAAFLFMTLWVWTDLAALAAPMGLAFLAALVLALRR